MKLIELHILQSFPVSCLNRDDVGAPKSAIFGGCPRARISSQCLKRAIREMARDEYPAARFGGKRTRLILGRIGEALKKEGIEPEQAQKLAAQVADLLAGLDTKTVEPDGTPKGDNEPRVGTLIFLSQAEIEALAADVAALVKNDVNAKLDAKKLVKACKSVSLSDAADIAIFGRMVAKGPEMTLEGAAMFGHALSTHKAENEIDFFSAVDDEKTLAEDAGAGHTGPLEFTSACYYRYAALNLNLLTDEEHLGDLSVDDRKAVVDAFLRATLTAVPGARKNSMNANTFPAYALGIVKDTGQPIQLVNAFEAPVWSKNGFVEKSIEALKKHHEALKRTWSIQTSEEVSIPDVPLDEFCQRLVSHVA